MDLRVSVSPANELYSLQDWLALEPEFRGRIKPANSGPVDGQLGTATDAIVVAVGAGGAVTALVGSLRVWFSQPRRADVRVTVHGPDGRSFEVDGKRIDDVEGFLRQALRPPSQE